MIVPRPRSKTLGNLYDRFIGDDPERVASYENALTNAEVATAIYELRTQAGLSQRALAGRVGTTASVICRLEDAEYEGHSLSMLRRVAAALGRRVEIRFPPATETAGAAKDSRTSRPTKRTALSALDSPGRKRTLADPGKTTRRAASKKARPKRPGSHDDD
jgi:transcriptional regulator with XRE-family HTH domain